MDHSHSDWHEMVRSLFPLHFQDQSQWICEGLISVYLGIYQELPSLPVLCLPIYHSLKDNMTLIPSSFGCVVVPVWFCNSDHLIPSGQGSYLVLPLPYWFITKPFISISNRFSQNASRWVGSQRLSQDLHHILPSKTIKESNTFKSSNIFLGGPLNSLQEPPWFFVFLDKKKAY